MSGIGNFATVDGNTIKDNGRYGVYIGMDGNTYVTNNKIVGNATDIIFSGSPSVNFNTVDTVTKGYNGLWKGRYNVNSNGEDVIVP